LSKTANIYAEYFGENIFKIMTSVPGHTDVVFAAGKLLESFGEEAPLHPFYMACFTNYFPRYVGVTDKTSANPPPYLHTHAATLSFFAEYTKKIDGSHKQCDQLGEISPFGRYFFGVGSIFF
jgi:hypothetical protein